jgi:hypothetical protein
MAQGDIHEDVEEMRLFSKSVFGNRYRLEVLAAIGGGEQQFYVQELSTVTGIPASTISAIVRDLEGHLVRPLPRIARNAPQYFERTDHLVFEIAAHLVAQNSEAAP